MKGSPYPAGFTYIWDYFSEISAGRQSGMNGSQPLSYTEILAWVVLTKRNVSAWDVEVIKSIDAVFMKTSAQLLQERRERKRLAQEAASKTPTRSRR
jgi:hypothetical protein